MPRLPSGLWPAKSRFASGVGGFYSYWHDYRVLTAFPMIVVVVITGADRPRA